MPDSLYESDALAWGQHQAVLLRRLAGGETASFLAGAGRRFTPSMRRRIDLDRLWADAVYEIKAMTNDETALPPLPAICPFSQDDLLNDRPDLRRLLVLLGLPPAVR
jgi:hypothetical protein